ncbi:hypothetical protein ACEUZ9_002216 [Paracoccus litorisediminis]|uniref:hypothetical protein n=1 Tax=Paracoccus litorisediminis TaxID=2006130 RepID=UPI0037346D4A
MTMISHRRGSRRIFTFDPEDENGQSVDSEGVTGELRVSVRDTCVALPIDSALEVNLQPLDEPAGDYVASVYLDWGEGLEFEGDILIRISEGC